MFLFKHILLHILLEMYMFYLKFNNKIKQRCFNTYLVIELCYITPLLLLSVTSHDKNLKSGLL